MAIEVYGIDKVTMVTVTATEYRHLLEAEVRLNILRKRRLDDIKASGMSYVTPDDYVLGEDVVAAAKAKEKASC